VSTVPPLVAPGADLTPEEVTRYSRHLLLPEIGREGQRRLKNARVLVVGAGGLGSPVLLYLAAAGVGTIGVVDDDVVDSSNLQRQVVHGVDDVGRPKVDSAAESVARVNPLVRVVAHRGRVDAATALDLVRGYDLVVDGTDNFPTRYVVSDACVLAGVPLVWGSILRFDGQVSVFWAEHGPTYRDLFPLPPPPGSVPSCGEAGVLGAVCAMVGSVMASEVVKLVTGAGEPLVGRMVVLDALATTWRTLEVRRDPAAAPVTAVTSPYPDEDAVPVVDAPALAALLADDAVRVVDVREADELAIVALPGAVHVPVREFGSGRVPDAVPRDRPVVLLCKSGVRSARALRVLRDAGWDDARHLEGGITAWVRDVDPSLPSY
jgi:molybdopterin/thiamine biosynthesis adenylyltransferase/rhodanese-related sulfurtransferase